MTAQSYLHARDVFVAKIAALSPITPIPACPGWTVSELLAHQLHQLAGMSDGSFPVADAIAAITNIAATGRQEAAARQQQWIAAGVAQYAERSVTEMTEEWATAVRSAPTAALEALVPDVVVHLFDLLGALEDRSHRYDPMVEDALAFWSAQAETRMRNAARSLRVDVVDGPLVMRQPGGVLWVEGEAFDVLRMMTGRRARSEVAVDASVTFGDADHVALYGWRDEPLGE